MYSWFDPRTDAVRPILDFWLHTENALSTLREAKTSPDLKRRVKFDVVVALEMTSLWRVLARVAVPAAEMRCSH